MQQSSAALPGQSSTEQQQQKQQLHPVQQHQRQRSSRRFSRPSSGLLLLLVVCLSCSCLLLGPASVSAARDLQAVKQKVCKRACTKGKYCINGKCSVCSTNPQCRSLVGPEYKCDTVATSATKGLCVLANPASKPSSVQTPTLPAAAKCTSDTYCTSEPLRKACDLSSGKCVQCTAVSHCQPLVEAADGLTSFTCANNLCIKVAQPLTGPSGDGGSTSGDGSGTTAGDGSGTTAGDASPPPPSTPPSTPPPPPPTTEPPVENTTTTGSPAGGDITSPPRECTTNADCPKRVTWDLARGPSCSPEGKCVQCNADADCPAKGLIVVGQANKCVDHACLACRVDDDCATATSIEGQGPYCLANNCVTRGKPCATDDECAVSFPICTKVDCPVPKCVDSFCDSGLEGFRRFNFML